LVVDVGVMVSVEVWVEEDTDVELAVDVVTVEVDTVEEDIDVELAVEVVAVEEVFDVELSVPVVAVVVVREVMVVVFDVLDVEDAVTEVVEVPVVVLTEVLDAEVLVEVLVIEVPVVDVRVVYVVVFIVVVHSWMGSAGKRYAAIGGHSLSSSSDIRLSSTPWGKEYMATAVLARPCTTGAIMMWVPLMSMPVSSTV